MKGLTWRILLVAFTVVFAVYLLLPTVLKWTTGQTVTRAVKDSDPWYYRLLPAEVLKLGLDLRGGVHLVIGINFEEVRKDAVTKVKKELETLIKDRNVPGTSVAVTPEGLIEVRYPSDEAWTHVDKIIGEYFSDRVDFRNQTANMAQLGLSLVYEANVRTQAIDQTLETLRNRIDEFGIAEPIIQRHGDDKVLVQFPEEKEVGRIKDIIARTARLSFQLERSGPEVPGGPPTAQELQQWVDQFVKEKKIALTATKPITAYLTELNAWLGKRIPEGTEVLFRRESDVNTREATYIPYLLEKEPIVTGDELEDAFYGYKPDTQEPIVHFRLLPGGAAKFEQFTGANVGKFMAIVLDGNVHSAPRINSRIGAQGIIEMGGENRPPQEVLKDVKDTALVLRSGALPAKIEFLEERVIGPSLGEDAIRAGTISLAVGLVTVFLFMAIYYRFSGVVAVLALALNGLFVLACMAAFEGTLTLPGLAGLTLTLGMAVDANVLIFEHIREELRAGKSVAMSIAEGYGRAFTAILDSNLTTIIAGMVLLGFGYGPIRGFAVTMLIGIAASMFTAIFVTRVVFDWAYVAKGKQSISI